MMGLCSYCSRYFVCSKRPKPSEGNVKCCSGFMQNDDKEDAIWEQRRYEIAKDALIGIFTSSIRDEMDPYPSIYEVVKNSVLLADRLIECLKEK